MFVNRMFVNRMRPVAHRSVTLCEPLDQPDHAVQTGGEQGEHDECVKN